LDLLEEAGYIEKIQSKKDKRVINIKLTKLDEDLKKKFFDVSIKMKEVYYNNFYEKEIDDFEAYLKRILQNLIKYNNKKK
jgi:DNA-binding MarR family transcriptional regulator